MCFEPSTIFTTEIRDKVLKPITSGGKLYQKNPQILIFVKLHTFAGSVLITSVANWCTEDLGAKYSEKQVLHFAIHKWQGYKKAKQIVLFGKPLIIWWNVCQSTCSAPCITLNLVTPWHSVRAMLANSEACCGLDIGMPDDTMYASPIVSTWIAQQCKQTTIAYSETEESDQFFAFLTSHNFLHNYNVIHCWCSETVGLSNKHT